MKTLVFLETLHGSFGFENTDIFDHELLDAEIWLDAETVLMSSNVLTFFLDCLEEVGKCCRVIALTLALAYFRFSVPVIIHYWF